MSKDHKSDFFISSLDSKCETLIPFIVNGTKCNSCSVSVVSKYPRKVSEFPYFLRKYIFFVLLIHWRPGKHQAFYSWKT